MSTFLRFDLNLTNFGVDMNNLKKATTNTFRCWVEDWEKKAMKEKCLVTEEEHIEEVQGFSVIWWRKQGESDHY